MNTGAAREIPVLTSLHLMRFWSKVRKDECWIWLGTFNNEGYGQFRIGGRSYLAHRVSFVDQFGEPRGVLDHLCRNRACVRPDHLEAVTQRENIRRGAGASARHMDKEMCDSGHVFTVENTYVWRGQRHCRECRRRADRRRQPDRRTSSAVRLSANRAVYAANRRARYAADETYRERVLERNRVRRAVK